ncbi:MAG: site-2 protease family protein [Burkholderiaceae bacterium]|jgi:Zn-dependent protease|nr:site-2 protease family protein [Burkholderiales bacterium]MCA3222384.1 site-2 protease family protein [Burkholderiales bacterium]MCA3229063.1 site-2 protease family protein [Burkholderiales bacterium]MCE2645781.1 site-2 protease family protein [Burkholderiaceae bacterium]
MEQLIQTVTVYAIPVLLAITLHEAAHGYVARMLGDQTAHLAGRITLNPLKHIDPVGTIAVPLLILIAAKALGSPGLLFGWAKPVPVSFQNLRRPKRDMIWVAAAGPGSNLLMAILWAMFLSAQQFLGAQEQFFQAVAVAGIQVNLVLMALNLLPVPPLDGGRIVTGLLPDALAWRFARIEPYGLIILIALLASGMLQFFIQPFFAIGAAIVSLFT